MNGPRFAEDWIAAWNARDLERILDHYAENIVLVSPTALKITGAARIEGRNALRHYWRRALDETPVLHFTLVRFYEGPQCMTIAYLRNGQTHVSETLEFENGKVARAVVTHSP
ncbi:MAG: nuclear transport factor 2 family protein [Hyphomicrobiales bacterium]|nr:nuclear transport factor 2 family protein [Hyphomicrobiales bacterium]